jgi:hypothetical protein
MHLRRVDLTRESAVVRGIGRRRVHPWGDVQAVVRHDHRYGESVVQLVLEGGQKVTLPYPRSLWRQGDRYERDFEDIDTWWVAHRGQSWRPSRPEATRPPG